MERIRNFKNNCVDFCSRTAQWRTPATAPYLFVVNSVFWACVFYCDHSTQLRLLLSLAAGIVSGDVLLSPSHDRSIAVHVALWPIQSLWKTTAVLLSLYSSHLLKGELFEQACWTAYGTVTCLLINPVWSYYDVNQSLINGAKYCGNATKSGLEMAVVKPLGKVYEGVKYVVLLQFVPPIIRAIREFFANLFTSIGNFFRRCWTWWKESVISPIKEFFYKVGRWLRYWFCAHWWPDLKLWLKEKVGTPLRRMFNYFCFCLVYVVCFHWFRPMCSWIGGWLQVFGGYLHRTIVVPTKLWMLARLEELRVWLRAQLHRLAVAIRDSVLWPICLLVVDAGKELTLLVYRIMLKPVVDYLYTRYKIAETAVLIYALGPVCETVINHIPEKNPFVDDSDVELEGLLPENVEDDADVDVDEREALSSRASHSAPSSPIHDEEHDFAAGLEFPTINASESSDDEFDLHQKPRQQVRQRRKAEKKPGAPGAEHDDEFEVLS